MSHLSYLSRKHAARLLYFAAAVTALTAACSDDKAERPPGLGSGNANTGAEAGESNSSTGASSSSGGEGSNTGGSSNANGGESNGSGGVPAGCGDGEISGDEECDGTNLGLVACADFGFDDGELSCNDDCSVNHSDCSGTEHCGDGRDNDGDELADCQDEDDCADACADPCSEPEEVSDPVEITATTQGREDAVNSTCSSQSAVGGPDSVYTIEAKHSGVLEVVLETDALMHVSVRDECTDGSAEIGCGFTYLSVPVSKGETLYVVVESYSPPDVGEFTLRIESRELNVCRDGYRDPEEECDDGNEEDLDACDNDCNLDSAEMEQNGTTATANTYHDNFYATIDPEGDVDVFSVEVEEGPASITATVDGLVDECVREKVDSFLELLDDAGDPIASNDDFATTNCSRLVESGLAAGTYFVRVTASDGGTASTFPYHLLVDVNECGDGVRGPGEECDDGDQSGGDGCSATCQNE